MVLEPGSANGVLALKDVVGVSHVLLLRKGRGKTQRIFPQGDLRTIILVHFSPPRILWCSSYILLEIQAAALVTSLPSLQDLEASP